MNIKALREGTAIITVYSDVDFKGKEITVHIKRPTVNYDLPPITLMDVYPEFDKVPTYTAVTGTPLISHVVRNNVVAYGYVYDENSFQLYTNFLLQNGYTYFGRYESSEMIMYYYRTPNGNYVCVAPLKHSNNLLVCIVSRLG